MRLAGSSNPSDVQRDTAVRLLAERAVLTRAVCRELSEAGRFADRRPCVALAFLLGWIVENLPESFRFRSAAGTLAQREPRASDGLDRMVVPDGCEDLLQEIRAGAEVGDALATLLTADNPIESSGDEAVIRDRLAAYWAKHEAPVRAPLPECWSGFSGGRTEPSATDPARDVSSPEA
jgi:hypothetical protein